MKKSIRLDVDWDCAGWVEALPPLSQLAWIKLLCHVRRYGAAGRAVALTNRVASKKWDAPVEAVAAMLAAAVSSGAILMQDDMVVVTEWGSFIDHRPPMPAWLRRLVLERDNWTCAYCGRDARTVDHVNPYSRGGTDDPDNLVAACKPCNSSKRDRTPEEWRA